ncbi:MAG: hypothetical protein V2B19_24705 [Pseudomonadota bacterium]
MIPKAELPSCTSHRLRLRIPSRRGDDVFFQDLTQRWLREFPSSEAVANPLTGSLLVIGAPPATDAVAEFGRRLSLFDLKPAVALSRSWAGSVEATILAFNRKIEQGSGGLLDLTSALFAALVIFGISELIRGHWKTPPWYTAFWYAFGVYSKVLLDQAAARRG